MSVDKIWREKTPAPDIDPQFAQKLKVSPILAKILAQRKISDVESARKFLSPSLKSLRDPYLFADMKKACERVCLAITCGETIGLFGDYDVDGVCSTAILSSFLKSVGAKVAATLPNRLSEGYGLSVPGIMRLKNEGATLLLTADCGILAHDNIEIANQNGFEVIVLDHHTVGETLPNAYAVVNPKRRDCPSQADFLCAAGVVFFLCIAIRRMLREQNYFAQKPEPDLKSLLDLVALASVCDVVPLKEDNRILVGSGLLAIKKSLRPGLAALIEVAGVNLAKISSTNLGFHLGPRINAAGRLDDAGIALTLLSTSDQAQAKMLAQVLDDTNQARKDLEANTVLEAKAMIEADVDLKESLALVLYQEHWHPGVVGIVASRIAETYHKPAIIIGAGGKGSGRSINGIDLHDMVLKSSDSLKGFGGHGHAIGLSLGEQGVEPFRSKLNQVIVNECPANIFVKEIYYEQEIKVSHINFDLQQELLLLEPFGAKNPYPVFRINQGFVRNLKCLNGGHIKGEIEGSDGAISFIGFKMEMPDEMVSRKLDFLGVIENNFWQGSNRLQFRLIDYKKS